MELNFIKPKETVTIAKITIHKTGKMGFSKGAIDLLNIESNGYFYICICLYKHSIIKI